MISYPYWETLMASGNQGKKGGGDTSNRGFASMDPEQQREIASKGGKAAHEKGTAHEFTSEEAREAGREGGKAAHERGAAHEFTPEEAREAGREGGKAAHEKGTAHEFTSEEAREAGRKGGQSSGGNKRGG
ncbi:MAG: stress-induced protein [Polaromonas sp.]|nr:stress-induced protein [Polaromonas sp.]